MASVANAQTAITPEALQKFQSQEQAPSDKAIRNAMARTSIAVLASDVNAQLGDTHFTYRVPNKGTVSGLSLLL